MFVCHVYQVQKGAISAVLLFQEISFIKVGIAYRYMLQCKIVRVLQITYKC
jgi:hypothetical protein